MLAFACKPAPTKPDQPASTLPAVEAPGFSGDSAYAFVKQQLAFGPRAPLTAGHRACGDWMVAKLKSYGAEVIEQTATVTAHDGKAFPLRNIIASYNPELTDRVLLSAHWDTRPRSDQDPKIKDQPIPGANDAGSGVAVLLELARVFQQKNPGIGVDLIFWDLEDYGIPQAEDSYCLGSQYWGKYPHTAGYKARYGVNLDMVGAKGARFAREGQSMDVNASLVNRMWQNASRLGYGAYFSQERTYGIIDDHLYVYKLTGIPCIDLIDQPVGQSFFNEWHTLADDLPTISASTLEAVGQTLGSTVYQEKPL